MRELKWTNKICGDCKNILAIIDGYRGYYCANCKCLWVRKDDNNKPVSKEEFDNLLVACLKTPPLRLKDLKEKLKKEQEEKKRRATS